MALLVGDIGGTKTVLALFETEKDRLICLREEVYPSANYDALETVIRHFLKDETQTISAACFGVAGPVMNGRCQAVNIPWLIEQESVAAAAGVTKISLLNDLQAAALGMLELPEDQLVELNPNAEMTDQRGNIAVIAAGTGLGEAILYWDGHKHHAFATEGGHSDFTSNCEMDDRLLAFLRERLNGHVSLERVISGPGLFTLYDFLRENGPLAQSRTVLAALEGATDPSAVVSQFALEKKDALCEEALRMFVRLYGVEAGNLALKCLSTGGVMVGGGIAPKILPALQSGEFLDGFLDKGRLQGLMKKMSVKVALNPRAPLLGSARTAAELVAA